jgi:hypothetical protein
MSFKLHAKLDRAVAKPALAGARPAAGAAGRRIIRLGRHWAIAVNWKIVGAIGLALLVWSLIVAVLASL